MSQQHKKAYRFSTSKFLLLSLIGTGLGLLFSMNHATFAAPTHQTTANGDWLDNTKWNPAAPGVGDSVLISNTMTVSSSASFGDNIAAFEPSIWTAGTLVINSGQTLTNVADSIFVKDTTKDLSMQGGGTFINQGTVDHQNNLWRLNANTIIQNESAYNFTENGSRLYFQQNGTRFHNMTGGSINVMLPVATNQATIDGPNADVDGNLVNFAATPMINFTQGILNYSPPNGGTLNDALFTSLFDVASLNANPASLRLGGGWDEINLTGATNLAKVTLGHTVHAKASGTIFNVAANGTNPNGLVWGSGSINIASGRTITNLETFTKLTATDLSMQGGGTFINQGTFDHQNNLLRLNANTVIQNESQYIFSENGSRLYFQQNGSRFHNMPGGSLVVALPAATNQATIDAPGGDIDGNLVNFAATPMITFTQGILNYSPPNGGTLTDALFASLFDAASLNANPAQLRLGGGWDAINLTAATDLTKVTLGHGFNTRPGGSTFNVTEAAGGLRWNAGTIGIASGRTLTNVGTFVKEADLTVQNGGTFLNQGVMDLQNSWIRLNANTVLENEATIILGDSSGHILFQQAGSQVINRPDAVIRASGTGNHLFQDQGVSGVFDNQGTLEITRGEVDLDNDLIVNQISGGTTLTGGTWKLLADAVTVKLDFRSGGTSTGDVDQTNFDGSITSIGAGASLVMSSENGGGVEFPQLGSIASVDGNLDVHGDLVLAVDSALSVTGSLGGDGTIGTAGTISFNGGELDPGALDGSAGTLTINGNLSLSDTTELAFGLGTPNIIGSEINDLIEVNGDLVLDGILDVTNLGGFGNGTYRLFNYTGTLTDNGLITSNPNYIVSLSTFGQVNLLVVPEPSTGLLLLAGIVLFRRKRKTQAC